LNETWRNGAARYHQMYNLVSDNGRRMKLEILTMA
jgi:hypothetical protein